MPLTFTFDLEDHQPEGSPPRFRPPTEGLLAWLDEHGARGTFFIVGALAARDPSIVAQISAAGHEVAVHALDHVPLVELGPQKAAEDLRRAREVIEDAAGAPAVGFRAPIFSLTRATPWAPEVLLNAGYQWSSSVLPAQSPLHGLPGAPHHPFQWECGLLELPCPVMGRGRASVPYLGGVYVRYIPTAASRFALKRIAEGVVPWTYLHPYDLDPDEPFYVPDHMSWLTSRILHSRRRQTLARIERLAHSAGGFGPPLGEIAAQLAGTPLESVGL